ncbi:MAG: RNA polymerase sigma factor [Candidatus Marinimicrobia bacterium]|nr:RNA polymerase sigma factor [Candidatus Neomarinimicrobiota bacterium]MBT3575129.1 RNA polymerase sigma factor [Candidatus Neomarinimicrobiota bacterium]MBT3680285.1 RNA polymerase sigma factor [Candidatus Neomarinimicrobiota bacterium]MBT3949564.1 RNA polymerase sigma factor [Candidatus Neomarinimicrobiota bacterium]MBT4252718.1 RNA polymerase sigma factor [Candidatus Neomarinimicrobiota bacterium]
MNDWQEYNLAKRGDRSAWKRLVDLHTQDLTRLAGMLTGSYDLAQDVVQEVMLELFRKPPKHQNGTFKGWLTTVTYHTALKLKKQYSGWSALGKTDPPDAHLQPLAKLIRDDRNRGLFDIIHSLDEAHREVLILRIYGDETLKDISTLLDIPLGTVKSRLFYGVRHCRKLMKDKGLT